MNEIEKNILNTINNRIKKHNAKLKFNSTIEGVIAEVVGGNIYKVKIHGVDEELKAIDGKQYVVGDIVKIMVYNNNYSDKAIWHKRV